MITDIPSAQPIIAHNAFIAPDAWIIGNVTIGEEASIFFQAVLRGDIERIIIGPGSNIQEQCIIHTSTGRSAAEIGSEVTVGHRAIIHGAKVGDRALIGMGAILLDDAFIEPESIIGAGALIPERMLVPSHSLVVGVPGKVVRKLTSQEIENLRKSAEHYKEKARMYRQLLIKA